jgi:hypothetical protein
VESGKAKVWKVKSLKVLKVKSTHLQIETCFRAIKFSGFDI